MSWVKENCLSLAGLLKYLSAREKLNLFIFIKAKELQQRRRGELIGENIKKKKKNIFHFCLLKEFTSMFISAKQLWSAIVSTASNLLSGVHILFSHSLSTITFFICFMTSFWCGQLKKEPRHFVYLKPERKKQNPQCHKKDEHEISAGAYVTLLTFLIEFIYLSTINNLWCNTQRYANEQFKFNEFLMTKQIISRAWCGVHVIWKGMNLRVLFSVWVHTA